MAASVSKARVSVVPPRELNVRKFAESRASELEGLHEIVANRLNKDFRCRRNSRKRTNAHDGKISKQRSRKKQKTGLGESREDDSVIKMKISRRVRRSAELKKNPQSGYCASGDGTKRLRTHVWHAKRFTMTKLWGFHIPLGLHGSGRGSRAILKKLKSGVLIHDASYYGTVQLDGPQETLLEILNSILIPSPSALHEEISASILSGVISGDAMLHRSRKPNSPAVAPVTYMWRPLSGITKNVETLDVKNIDELQHIVDGTSFRQVWVWIHASAFREAYDALRSESEIHVDATAGSVKCISLEGQLASLELIGSQAFQLLEKTLLPAACGLEKSLFLRICTCVEDNNQGEIEKATIYDISNQVSSSSVLGFTVKDPRALIVEPISGNSLESVGYNDLWNVMEGIPPPLEESLVCMEKHYQRMKFIALSYKSYEAQNTSENGKYSRCCPILLQNNGNYKDAIKRCSVILPLNWVKVFWNIFISHGAHAIGLREKHWVSCEIQLPFFPLDYPDCDAYWSYMAKEAEVSDQKAKLRPPSKRPLEIPIPPPWGCVQPNFLEVSSSSENSFRQLEQSGFEADATDNMVTHADLSTSEPNDVPFDGVVARTSSNLHDYLNAINGNNFLVFPKMKDQKNSIYKIMNDEEFLKQDAVLSEMKFGKMQCLLRVVLHAYKEGVFEQGAVVCAPNAADVTSWTSLDSDDQQLQISQSSLRSYFLKKPSGNWQLQPPLDSADQESFRWPIGFVTTGFVRGSKKAVALALCEASLLSKLRLEQWKTLPVRHRRKEIYVLVRNMRSTAYRFALATVVLEQQEDDVKFM